MLINGVFRKFIFGKSAILFFVVFSVFVFSSESPMITVIKTEATSSDYESKKNALSSIKEFFIDAGKKNTEVLGVLEYLSLEGTRNIALLDNSISNNFPDIRHEALVFLGEFSYASAGEEAASGAARVLESVTYIENEPDNLVQAFLSLAEVEKDDSNSERRDHALDVINLIYYRRNAKIFGAGQGAGVSVNNPVGLAYLNAVEVFFTNGPLPRNSGIATTVAQVKLLSDNYNYITPVRAKAKELLNLLKEKADSGSQSAQTPQPAG